MNPLQDEVTLKLHVDPGGGVWFADGNTTPLASGLTPAEFLPRLQSRQNVQLRILGTDANAGLITLAFQHCALHGGQLELATPLVCESSQELTNPAVALYRMRQCRLPASLGGWRVGTAVSDYPTYALCDQLHKSNGNFTQHVSQLLYVHPVWHDLSFIGGVSPEWCARLIALVRDPRWYINCAHPDRISRYRGYLGLIMQNQRLVSSGQLSSVPVQRCHTVLRCWCPEAGVADELQERPEFFLWRIRRAAGGGTQGDLVASQQFATYLWFTWLQAIHTNSPRYGGCEQMFAPEMLFNRDDEIAAYKSHASTRK